jgi:hypothetical protein
LLRNVASSVRSFKLSDFRVVASHDPGRDFTNLRRIDV